MFLFMPQFMDGIGGTDRWGKIMRLIAVGALIAILTPGAAVAEPIIIIISQHNLQYASGACSYPLLIAQGIAECKFAGDGQILGESLRTKLGLEWRLIPAARAWMYSSKTILTMMVRITLMNLQTK
jgi:hypothetical protein